MRDVNFDNSIGLGKFNTEEIKNIVNLILTK